MEPSEESLQVACSVYLQPGCLSTPVHSAVITAVARLLDRQREGYVAAAEAGVAEPDAETARFLAAERVRGCPMPRFVETP